MIAGGWLLEHEGYVSDLLLQLGSAFLLAAPIVYLERVLSGVRHELDELRRQTAAVSSTYEQIRVDEPSGPKREAKLNRLMRELRAEARSGKHSPKDVAELFAGGSRGERITALGLMQGNHALVSVDAIADGIRNSRSAFEQYAALRLAGDVWEALGGDERDRVAEAVNVAMGASGYIHPGTDRYPLARAIQRAHDQAE